MNSDSVTITFTKDGNGGFTYLVDVNEDETTWTNAEFVEATLRLSKLVEETAGE